MTPQKKQILQKILESLVPYWDLAEWFLLLLQEEWNEELEKNLYQTILKEIKNINSEAKQQNIKNALQKLKEKSNTIIKIDEEEADKMLNDFINNI